VLKPDPLATTHIRESNTLGPDGYLDFGYWLNKGSDITVSFSTAGSAYIYLFKGDGPFSRWEADSDSTEGIQTSQYSHSGSTVTLRYFVKESEMFYITFDNDLAVTTSIEYDIKILRSQFDLTDEVPTCSPGSYECNLDLGFMKDDIVILQAPYSTLHMHDPVSSAVGEESWEVEVTAELRWGLFIGVMTVPLLLLYFFCYKDCNCLPSCCRSGGVSGGGSGYELTAFDETEQETDRESYYSSSSGGSGSGGGGGGSSSSSADPPPSYNETFSPLSMPTPSAPPMPGLPNVAGAGGSTGPGPGCGDGCDPFIPIVEAIPINEK